MKSLKIGRSSANDIVLSDVTVSSQHAIISILDTKEVRIKDLNSTNGTFVNGKRISGEVLITANDEIKVGNHTLDWLKYLNGKPKPSSTVFSGDASAIKQKKTIGSLASNDIVLNHSDVSRNHAQLIEKVNGDIVIADSGSTNGTYVNGKRISMQTLRTGDRVLIANNYSLDWENVFGKKEQEKRKKNLKTIFIAAAAAAVAAVIVGVVLFLKPWEEKPWTAEQIYAHYKKSVGMIELSYYYEVFLDDEHFGYVSDLKKDRKGNIIGVVFTKSEEEAKKNSRDKLGLKGTGTGFFVSKEGEIITNRHNVVPWEYFTLDLKKYIKEYVETMVLNHALTEDARYLSKAGKVTVIGKMDEDFLRIYINGTHSDAISCVIRKESGSTDIDIAVMQTKSHTLPTGVVNIVDLTKAVIDDANIVEGEPIYTIGFPAGEFLGNTKQGIQANNQDGKITQLRGEYEFGHNIPIIGGASGSPVFNKYGNLIGVIHKGFSGSQGFNMAIKAKHAVELAK